MREQPPSSSRSAKSWTSPSVAGTSARKQPNAADSSKGEPSSDEFGPPARENSAIERSEGGAVTALNSDAPQSDRSLDRVVDIATLGIRLLALVITICVWTVVGFVFWVPLLARNTLAFSTYTLYANLREGNARVNSLGLEHAITFYVNGFRNIIDGILCPVNDSVPFTGPKLRLGYLLIDVTIAGFFWWCFLVASSSLGITAESLGQELSRPVLWAWEQIMDLIREAF